MSYKLKIYRQTHHLSQLELAEKLGISKSLVSMVESGKRSLSQEAQDIFRHLHKDHHNYAVEDLSTIDNSFKKMMTEHAINLGKSIPKRIGDLRAEIHVKTSKIERWNEQVNFAIAKLQYIQGRHNQFPNGDMPKDLKTTLIGERYRAEASIARVLGQNPELKVSEIISLQAELDHLTKGKGQLKNRIGFDVKEWLTGLPKLLNSIGPSDK